MTKLFLFFSVAALAAFGGPPGAEIPMPSFQCKPCVRPDGQTENKAPNVTSIDLSKSQLLLPSRLEGEPEKPREHSREMTVEVKVTAEDPGSDVLTYNYTVSGGRIVGTGAKVVWDLNGVRPGTYTITAGVDDGCGICGKTDTRTVSVSE